MTNNMVVSGRGRVTREIEEDWEYDVSFLWVGEKSETSGKATGRPSLAGEILPVIQDVSRNSTRGTCVTTVAHIKKFWIFLDEMETVAAANNSVFPCVNSVLQVPGQVWGLFVAWLKALPITTQHYIYFNCKRCFDRAAEQRVENKGGTNGFPLPVNPFPNPQKAAAADGGDVVIDPLAAKKLTQCFFEMVQQTDMRLVSHPRRTSEAFDSYLAWATKHEWKLPEALADVDAILPAALPEPWVVSAATRVNPLLRGAYWFVPAREDLEAAYWLVMHKHGWNEATTLLMDVNDWYEDYGKNGKLARIFSHKIRAGKDQEAYCRKTEPRHTYSVINKVIAWTTPLRDALLAEEGSLRHDFTEGLSTAASQKRLDVVVKLKSKVWLYLNRHGGIGALSDDDRFEYLNQVVSHRGISELGDDFRLSQRYSRDSYGVFAYEASGYNLVVTQLALSHSDISTLLHYINQKAIANKNRRKFFELQSYIVDETSNGRLNLKTLKNLMSTRKLKSEEAARVLSGGAPVSRQGFACANAYEPEQQVDPGHVVGKACGSQNCMAGCSKAFVTASTLEFCCQRMVELEKIQATIPVLAWITSDHPHDLEFIQELIALFPEKQRSAAVRRAREVDRPVIYTVPTAYRAAQP